MTPAAMAADAAAVVAAGAGSVHLHPKDGDGADCLEPAAEALAAHLLDRGVGIEAGLWTVAGASPAELLLHGEDDTAWPLVAHAAAAGWSTRIGLEDVTTMADGRPAPDDAALVRAAVRICPG